MYCSISFTGTYHYVPDSAGNSEGEMLYILPGLGCLKLALGSTKSALFNGALFQTVSTV